MMYYKVLSWCDGHQFYRWSKRYPGMVVGAGKYMIENELLTERERNKYCNHDKHFIVVEVPKNRVYWSFGARFEIKKEGA